MTEEQTIETADEVAVEPVVQRSRGRPRKEKPIVEKRPRGRPKKLGPMKEKRPRGRPKKIREFREKRPRGRPKKIRECREKRPPGRPRKWTAETRPKYKPKDPDYNKKYYRNVVKPKLEAKKAERVTRSHLMEKLLGMTVAEIIELMRSSSVT